MAHKRSPSRTRSKPSGSSTTAGARPTAANTSRASSSLPPKQHAERASREAPSAARRTAPAATSGTGAPTLFSPADIVRSHPWVFGGALLATVAVIIFSVIQLQSPPAPAPLAAGKRAPDFALTAADGNRYSLSQYRGHVVVLEFFAPWCPHCRNETSVLNQAASTGGAQGVQVLSVSATPYGYNYESSGGADTTPIAMKDITEFVTNYHVTYPAMLDTSLKVGDAYSVAAFPQLFVIDRNGTVTWNNGTSGEVSYADLQAQIQRAQHVPLTTATAAAPTVRASAAPAK
jgi:peroxiredoxin